MQGNSDAERLERLLRAPYEENDYLKDENARLRAALQTAQARIEKMESSIDSITSEARFASQTANFAAKDIANELVSDNDE